MFLDPPDVRHLLRVCKNVTDKLRGDTQLTTLWFFKNRSPEDALDWAVKYGELVDVRMVLRSSPHTLPSAAIQRKPSVTPPLHHACRQGILPVVKTLLDGQFELHHVLDINAIYDGMEDSPLNLATRSRRCGPRSARVQRSTFLRRVQNDPSALGGRVRAR